MPLKEGCSREVHSENVAILRNEGVPEKQAVAIAYKKARLYAEAHGKHPAWLKRKGKRSKKGKPPKAAMRGARRKPSKKKRSTVKTVRRPTSLRSAVKTAKKKRRAA